MILSFLEILTLTLEDSPTRGHPRFIGKSSKLHVNSAWVALSHWCRGNPNWCDWCDMSGEGITVITSTKATLLTHGYCLSGRIKYREDIVHIQDDSSSVVHCSAKKKRTNQRGSLGHRRMTPSQKSQATAPLVELKSTVKNAFQPFVSDTLMEQISDQLAANGLLGVEMLGLVVAIRSMWGNKSWTILWPVFHSDGGLCFIQGQLRVYSW